MSIGIAWVIHTFIGSGLVFSIVVFVLIVILFLTLFYCKSKISYYDMKQRYQLLLQSSKGLEPTTCKFDNNWLLRLKQNHYAMFLDNPNFTIYYKIEKSISKKTFIKTHVIQILTIIKNSDLDLFSNQIELEYKSLWMKFEKEYRLNKQVIIQFVKYKSFDDTIKNNLDRIISYKEGDNYMIHINCGYFIDSQSIYYLHSDTYYPNIYYKYAIDNIKDNTN
ncbi:MAG: hypothetical protein JXC31_00570 [Acholeplasmataceae bacterium]|nr:hypothetical protein [Acholeplasmataceae bacterium]